MSLSAYTADLVERRVIKDHTSNPTPAVTGEPPEPRFHPCEMGSKQFNAESLISPREADPLARYQKLPVVYRGADPNAGILRPRDGTSSGFATGNSGPKIAALSSAPQGRHADAAAPPTLSRYQAARLAADSSRRYFWARDNYDTRFLTSSNYFANDAIEEHARMKAR